MSGLILDNVGRNNGTRRTDLEYTFNEMYDVIYIGNEEQRTIPPPLSLSLFLYFLFICLFTYLPLFEFV